MTKNAPQRAQPERILAAAQAFNTRHDTSRDTTVQALCPIDEGTTTRLEPANPEVIYASQEVEVDTPEVTT